MRKTLMILGALLAGWLWWGSLHANPDRPTTPVPTTASTQLPTAKPTAGGQAPTEEEGMESGGFDPASPPAGAPDTEQVQRAFGQAKGYVEAINSYGYGDATVNDFIIRAKPFMTGSFYEEWNDIAQLAIDEGSDTGLWAQYQTSQTRHAASTGTPSVTHWSADSLHLAVPYRTADLPVGGRIPDSATERFARVQLVKTGDLWLVQHATLDF